MQINSHLNFNGNCADAMAFYEGVFKTKVAFKMTYGESPMSSQMPPAMQDKILHASMKLGNNQLMAADCPPERYQKPQGIVVSISVDTVEEGKRIFDALADGGSVVMPYEETFWAKGFGMPTDKFGIPWMVNCEKPMPQQ